MLGWREDDTLARAVDVVRVEVLGRRVAPRVLPATAFRAADLAFLLASRLVALTDVRLELALVLVGEVRLAAFLVVFFFLIVFLLAAFCGGFFALFLAAFWARARDAFDCLTLFRTERALVETGRLAVFGDGRAALARPDVRVRAVLFLAAMSLPLARG